MASVTVRGQFAARKTVYLYDRVGDWYAPSAVGKPVQKAKVPKDGVVSFEGLKAGAPFWVADGERGIAVTAKERPAPKVRVARPSAAQAAQAQAPGSRGEPEGGPARVTGARSTATAVPQRAKKK